MFPALITSLGLLLLLTGGAVGNDLPRVLFLGDRVHKQILDSTAKELKDRVRIEHAKPPLAEDTGQALARFEELIGDGDWDLIYFNFGLGDLLYRDPRTSERRGMSKHSGGVRVTSAGQYAKNLEALVQRLQETGSKLIWANTTPTVRLVRGISPCDNLFDAGSEIEYNRIAAKIMTRHKVPVADMHGYAMKQFATEKEHPNFEGYNSALLKKSPLHEPAVRIIVKHLGAKVPESAPTR